MKSYALSLIVIFAFIIGCNTQQKPVAATNNNENNAIAGDTVRIANEELEYEVIIIDPGFPSWLNSRSRPRGYYSQSYLENKNLQWITEWNVRASQPARYGDMYQM